MAEENGLALLKQEMINEEVHIKVNAVHRMKTIILSLGKVLFFIIEIVVHYGLIHIISTMVTSAFFEVGFKIIITRGITGISSLSNTRIICNLSHIFYLLFQQNILFGI